MNVQFKKGVLELCVLALTAKADRYGYELVHRLSETLEIAEGTVYPILRRLTKEGLFTTYLAESSEGPPRKYYHLTTKGEQYLADQVREWREFYTSVNQVIEEDASP
ncbi:PadR family transcriptional regulator [Alicyclobacillus ferrooxydans]|uniref:PadR family transcriptional regulator n=1 Tax=Alicyclobacillus ferrooxydans TaxID=471514 RepID=A0A0N8PPI8_9BACL|nr:PadR family transcriptional regulator [Alicyclobacillus ferrooxydans]KPV44445.1 PadR family transcriptional regulator [Alicyclobacillus ferrooxydans]